MEIIKAEEYGLEPTKASELMGNLPTILEDRKSFEMQLSEIKQMDIEDPNTAKLAKELRLKFKDNRTKGITVWHKNAKDFFLKGGQFVDAIKRKEIAVNELAEEQLEQIEKYAEIKAQKILDELEEKRKQEAEPFAEFIPFGVNLRLLTNEDFSKLLEGAKLQLNAKLEAERIAEEERIAKEKAEAEAREQQRLENERLKAEAEAREKEIAEERARVEAERKKKEDEAKKERELMEAKLKAEQEAREKEIAIERAKAEAEKQKLEAELKAKEQEAKRLAEIESARIKAEQEAKAKVEQEAKELAKAPIKVKLNAWIDGFSIPEMKEAEAQEIINKFNAFKSWAKKEIEKL